MICRVGQEEEDQRNATRRHPPRFQKARIPDSTRASPLTLTFPARQGSLSGRAHWLLSSPDVKRGKLFTFFFTVQYSSSSQKPILSGRLPSSGIWCGHVATTCASVRKRRGPVVASGRDSCSHSSMLVANAKGARDCMAARQVFRSSRVWRCSTVLYVVVSIAVL